MFPLSLIYIFISVNKQLEAIPANTIGKPPSQITYFVKIQPCCIDQILICRRPPRVQEIIHT